MLIVDDGSTDNTNQVVENWCCQNPNYVVRYLYQANQGKHAAHNTAIDQASGEFIVILDSDDALTSTALAEFMKAWDSIPISEREFFAGIEGLCAYRHNNAIVGTKFPVTENMGHLDSNYLELYQKFNVQGDKKNAILTSVLREFKFPYFKNEKFIPEATVWKRIALKYKFRYFNHIVQLVEYQADGLSSDPFMLRYQNPHGFRLFFQEEINIFSNHKNKEKFGKRFRIYDRYVRYSLHAGIGFLQQWRDIKYKKFFLLCYPSGLLHKLSDSYRYKKRLRKNKPLHHY